VIDARSTHRNALEDKEEVLVEDPPAAGGGQAGSVKDYRDIINLSECSSVLANTVTTISDGSTTESSGSPTARHRSCDSLSKSSQAEAGKLFPRNMPSIRRSRRRAVSAERERLASRERNLEDQVQPPKMTQINPEQQSRLSTVTKLTPRKPGGKSTCSKNRGVHTPAKCIIKSAVRAKTKPKPKITLAPYEIALELPNESPAPTLAMAVAQSSGCEQRKLVGSEEQFHSSGISCNGETDDDVEVAMLTGSLTPAELARIQVQGHQKGPAPSMALPFGDLRNLNLCRNRNAVWLNPKDTERLIEVDRSRSRNCYFNLAIADDIQLSDIEEQLARFDGQSKRPPPPAATAAKM